jgi:hypothetical protein
MKTAAFAIAWSLWCRRRTALTACALAVLALAILSPLLFKLFEPPLAALLIAVPLIGIFGCVLDGLLLVEDSGSMTSNYPRHMFALPVPTHTLVFWPMLYALSAIAVLWAATAALLYLSSGFLPPLVLPVLGIAALMAWAQAFSWLPLRIEWLRTMLLLVVMSGLGAVPIRLAATWEASPLALDAVLVAYIAAAYAVAWAAVSSDRRGQTWRVWPSAGKLGGIVSGLKRHAQRPPFRSAFGAQVWYEWNCHRAMASGSVRLVLFLIWVVLMAAGRRDEGPQLFLLRMILLCVVVNVVFGAAGTGLGRLRPVWIDPQRAITFLATRPISSGGMVAAKFRMVTVSLVFTWLFAAAAIAVWIVLSGNPTNARILWHELLGSYPPGRGMAIAALACLLLPAASWRFLTGSIAPGIAGRKWIADGAVWLYFTALAVLGYVGFYLARNPGLFPRFHAIVPWLVVAGAFVKGSLAIASFRGALRRGLLAWPAVGAIVGLWLGLTACGVALATLAAPSTGLPVSAFIAALGIATFVPLVRFPLATLALDWNRHR